jgi:hypothetical protein
MLHLFAIIDNLMLFDGHRRVLWLNNRFLFQTVSISWEVSHVIVLQKRVHPERRRGLGDIRVLWDSFGSFRWFESVITLLVCSLIGRSLCWQ